MRVDPMSCCDFYRFMDGARKITKYILPGVAATLTAGCTSVEIGQILTRIPEPTKTNPLPSDFTATPSPTDANFELTPTVQNPATQELTLVPPTEVATEIAPVEVIKINMDNIIYPPLSNVRENFEKGEYDSGLETIKQWVNVWEKMGILEGLEIENNSLSLVPLDGRARIVCVDTEKKGTGTLLCPPLDLVNGGLKTVPAEGGWDETDKPLLITFHGTEELVTKGNGNELVYQFVDKYSDKQTRYFDSKTGQIIEGISLITDVEMVENEVVIEGATGVSAEFLFDGNLKINEEAGRKYYKDFIYSLAGNEQNKEYLESFLGANPDGNKLLDYLKKNDYVLPSGLNLPYERMAGYVNFGGVPTEESIKLDTLKIVVFGPNQWNSSSGEVKEYITSLKSYRGLWVSPSFSVQYFGWAIDLIDNRLVMVAGAKETAPEKYPHTEKMTIGGFDGGFNFERDSAVASGELIQINKLLKVFKANNNASYLVSVFPRSICGIQESSVICDEDLSQLFGQGKTMFEPAK